jgi:hypothetical protein
MHSRVSVSGLSNGVAVRPQEKRFSETGLRPRNRTESVSGPTGLGEEQMGKHIVDSTTEREYRPDARIEITPGGLYVTVDGQPTVCMFSGGTEQVNLRLDRGTAVTIGRQLIDLASK